LSKSIKNILDEKYYFSKYINIQISEYSQMPLKHIEYLFNKLCEDMKEADG